MRPDGREVQNLSNHPGYDYDPQWSPDSQWIVFQSERGGNRNIYRMKADGSMPQRLTDNATLEGGAQWSPDGQWITFASNRDGPSEIYRMHADGSHIQRLTFSKTAGGPQWSPDGEWIAYVSYNSVKDNSYVYRMRSDGSEVQCLTANLSYSRSPQWSPPLKRAGHPGMGAAVGIGLIGVAVLVKRKAD